MTRHSEKLLDELKQARLRLRSKGKASAKKPSSVAGSTAAVGVLFLKATSGARPAPRSVLFVKPDSYGDLVLFAPVLACLRAHWPETRLGLLLQARHQDVVPLLPVGVDYILTPADPFRQTVVESPHVPEIARMVREFNPEILVASAFEKTWIHAVTAIAAPDARRISVGPSQFDATTEHYLRQQGFDRPATLYAEQVDVEKSLPELEKARAFIRHLCGEEVPPLLPKLALSASVLSEADRLISDWGLARRHFVVCNPAGVSNVPIKAWPAHSFAEVLGWLHARHKLPVLLCAHRAEKSIVDEVVRLMGEKAKPLVWLGETGQFPLLAALVSRAQTYFGGDTSTLHVAEAVGTPVVAVFGGGTWPRFRPVHRDSLALIHPLPGFGCGWDCHLGDATCLKLIHPEDVMAAWAPLLRKHAPPQIRPKAIELAKLPPQHLENIRRSRELYAHLEQDREARYAQILTLTGLAHKQEADIVFLNSSAAALRNELERLNSTHRQTLDLLTETRDRLANETRQREVGETALSEMRAQLAAQLAQQAAEKDALAARLAKAESLASARSAELHQTAAALAQLRQAHQQAGEDAGRLHAQLADHAAQLAQQAAEKDALMIRWQKTAAALETAGAENRILIARLAETAAIASAREKHVATLTAELEASQAQLSSEHSAYAKFSQLFWVRFGRQFQLLPSEEKIGSIKLPMALSSTEATLSNKTSSELTGWHQRFALAESELAFYRAENARLAQEINLLRRTALPGDDVRFHIESCKVDSGCVEIAGWAFCLRIDCAEAVILLWLVAEAEQHPIQPRPVLRPDVRDHFAHIDLGAGLPSGDPRKTRLGHSGFTCRLPASSLGTGRAYQLDLQIEGPQFSVRRPTGVTLHV